MSIDSLVLTMFLALGVAVALPVHEYAHAVLALRLGDRTPANEGRLTFDPRRHLDPFGSLILPGITLLPVMFGQLLWPVFAYAKPQGQNTWALRNRTRDPVLVALAGPAANLILAFALGAVLRVVGGTGQLAELLTALLFVNVTLAVLNLVPLPPFDGARVLAQFLSPRAREVFTGWEPLGALFIIVIFFIFAGPIFRFLAIVSDGICNLAAGTSIGCDPSRFLPP